MSSMSKSMGKFGVFGLVAAAIASVALAAGPGEKKDATATKAEAAVGQKAPDFTLADLDGKQHKLSEITASGKVVVLEWYNPECPFVKKHYRDDTGTMNKLAEKYASQNVVWVRINSGAEGKQGAGAELNRKMVAEYGITTPVLLDTTGEVGKTYGAKHTPEMFIIAADGTIAYHGAIDDDSRAAQPGKVNYVDQALQQVLAGETVTTATTKPYGCSVKY